MVLSKDTLQILKRRNVYFLVSKRSITTKDENTKFIMIPPPEKTKISNFYTINKHKYFLNNIGIILNMYECVCVKCDILNKYLKYKINIILRI